jgi:D-glycero-D-manno-heptose 1,7-bisphosphate phosphatase
MKRAVFLDRDGVINKTRIINGIPSPPSSSKELELIDGVVESVRRLKTIGFLPVVVTNQPDIARGLTDKVDVEAINSHIRSITGIEYFYVCVHDDFDMCKCRKPAPGLLYDAALDLKISLKDSFMVGDRWRDIAAGQAAGCKNFFIDYKYPEKQPVQPFKRVSSLIAAVDVIVDGGYEYR